MENTIINDISELKADVAAIANVIYPVGSIYLSVNSTNPKTLFGGTWTQLKDRFLLGAGEESNGSTGGATSHSHGYRIGYRSYYQNPAGQSDNWILAYDYLNKKWVNATGDEGVKIGTSYSNQGTETANIKADNAVGLSVYANTTATSSLPPYLVVYMWKRTA